jgi:hypothetical protein
LAGSFATPLSPFGRMISLVPVQESSQVITLVLAFIPLLYMSFCTYRSLLLIRLPFIRSFDMYSGRLTDAYALMKNAAYLCRLQFTLGVNFLRCVADRNARALILFVTHSFVTRL